MINKISLDKYSLIDTLTTSSKGNQLKWLVNGKWYKADHMGYEGLCEVVISRLLKKSNVNSFVEYHPIQIEFNGRTLSGCYSDNFKKKNESIVTLERLSKQYLSSSMAKKLTQYPELTDKITRTVKFIETTTKLNNAGKYITTMLELDAFFLNEDRHTNNIAFILNDDTGKYKFCPYFDFGLSLLADIKGDYPLGEDIYTLINKIFAKPFDRNFDTQLDAAQGIYGNNLMFSFSNADIENAFSGLEEYYPDTIIKRAKELLYNQKSKYLYMF